MQTSLSVCLHMHKYSPQLLIRRCFYALAGLCAPTRGHACMCTNTPLHYLLVIALVHLQAHAHPHVAMRKPVLPEVSHYLPLCLVSFVCRDKHVCCSNGCTPHCGRLAHGRALNILASSFGLHFCYLLKKCCEHWAANPAVLHPFEFK